MSDIKFHRISNNKDAIREFQQQQENELFQFLFENIFSPERLRSIHEGCILDFRVMNIICNLVFLDSKKKQILVLGPILTETFNDSETLKILHQFGLSKRAWENFKYHCNKLPVIPLHKFYHLGEMIYNHLSDNKTSFPILRIDLSKKLKNDSILSKDMCSEKIDRIRDIEYRYETSALLTEAIKQGNLSLALTQLQKGGSSFDIESRNKNPLRRIYHLHNRKVLPTCARVHLFFPKAIDTVSCNLY